ncbi:SIR2 family protein [Mesorhizobium opportunistum]|uniref:P-loop NTPase n=1 Tax=Mesorhizobium opportunistum TaxID=593909 RepID=UPI00333DF397
MATAVTPSQEAICNYPWKEIYTTNYDNVVEICLAKLGRQHSVYTPLKRPADVDYETLPIIHINGYMQTASFIEFKKEIKLTDAQYFSDDFSRSAWGERFRNDIVTSPCIIFAGYSLYDLDIARILNTFEGMKERIFFVVKENPSRSLVRKLSQFGTILDIGVIGFSKIVSEISLDKVEPKRNYLSAWEQTAIPNSRGRPLRDIDVINFLMSGSLDENQFAIDTIENIYGYTINRESSDYVSDSISSGKLKNALIYSNAGNGKSTFLDSVAYKLAARNFQVFKATSNSSLLLKEFPIIRNISGNIALVVDDVFSHIDLVKAAMALGRDNIYIVASARTSQIELQESEIRKSFNDSVELFSLDSLSDGEIVSCIEFLDKYALWGARQVMKFEQKKAFIKNDCSRELRFVILEALDSPTIRSRIQQILDFKGAPEARDRVRAVLILSQLLNMAQVRSDLTLISELVQFDARLAISDHSASLRDFSLIRNGQISIRSSIFSDYVIKNSLKRHSLLLR